MNGSTCSIMVSLLGRRRFPDGKWVAFQTGFTEVTTALDGTRDLLPPVSGTPATVNIPRCVGCWRGTWHACYVQRRQSSVVSPECLYVWRRSGACIARPTREGYRVVCRPRRTSRGACLGGAKRQEISLPGHYAQASGSDS